MVVIGVSNKNLFISWDSPRRIFFKLSFWTFTLIQIDHPINKVSDYWTSVFCRFLPHFLLHSKHFNL